MASPDPIPRENVEGLAEIWRARVRSRVMSHSAGIVTVRGIAPDGAKLAVNISLLGCDLTRGKVAELFAIDPIVSAQKQGIAP